MWNIKKVIVLSVAMMFALCLSAQVTNPNVRKQKGYYRSNGTYVKPHYKTKSNNTNWDNFSTKGNQNCYTGSKGSKAKNYSNEVYNYGKDKKINKGPKGGQYYKNSNGNRTYIPKRAM